MGRAEEEPRARRKSQRERLRVLTGVISELSAGGVEIGLGEREGVRTGHEADDFKACIDAAEEDIGNVRRSQWREEKSKT
jgi:hypothetical protein